MHHRTRTQVRAEAYFRQYPIFTASTECAFSFSLEAQRPVEPGLASLALCFYAPTFKWFFFSVVKKDWTVGVQV